MTNAAIDQANDTRRTALGTLLIERGMLEREQLDEALRIGADTGERLGEVLVRLDWTSEEDLARVLAEQWQLRYFQRSEISFDGRALRRMSWEDASRLEALPIKEDGDGAVVVAVAEPTEARFLALRGLLGDRIDFVVVARTAIEAGLRGDLLARHGNVIDEAAPPVADDPEIGGFEMHQETYFEAPPEPADPFHEPAATSFDEVARTLSESLTSQLDSLRAIAVEAQAQHESDRREIERLTAELSARSETIRSMQQTLRDFADTLEHSA